jgi:hypothetical protein
VIVEKYGIQKEKLECHTGWAFGGILGIVGGNNFSNLVSYRVGDGSRIRFLHDVWYEEVALKSSFPELYSLARNKEASVSNYVDPSSTYIHWSPRFF